MTSDPAAELERFLAARVRDGWMPCAAWAVDVDGVRVAHGAVGETAPGVAARATTPFDLASLTKPLCTATLLVDLEQQGRLDPDAPLADSLPEMAGSPYGAASLVALAAHTAGLAAWQPLFVEASTIEGYLAAIAARPPAVRPGTTLYSDLGYILIGAALERVTDRPLDVQFRERVAGPLELSRTGYARGADAFADAAATESGSDYERGLAGAAGDGFAWRSTIPRGQVHDCNAHGIGGVAGHAGLFGPAADLARWGNELLRPRLAGWNDRARERMLRVVPPSAGRTVGLVCADHTASARGILTDRAVGHTGFTGTSLWVDPTAGAVYVLLTNRIHPRVPRREFRWLRRGFHRLARRLARAG